MTQHSCDPRTVAEQLDQRLMAAVGRHTASMSPTLAWLSFVDWVRHLAVAPGHQFELLQLALSQQLMLAQYVGSSSLRLPPLPLEKKTKRAGIENMPVQDWRFTSDDWHHWPYNIWHQSYLLADQWWRKATTDVPGVSDHHAHVVSFAASEWLKLFSPRHYLLTNPEVQRKTLEEWGANLVRGTLHLLDDAGRQVTGAPPYGAEQFVVGKNVATTPGKVIARNALMELIQYEPTTAKVRPEPILIVPAWIMKYYILDLSPHNSLIRYLVDQGYTVFCLSWKNPGFAHRHMGMDDYLSLGFFQALDTINHICPASKVHALGYCLGGTLLAIAAAAMARDGDDRLASVSMLAAQTDFSEPGELSLFIDESQVTMLECVMADVGYLTTEQMAGAFKLLRSDYMVWNHLVETWLMGERQPMSDLMAWNADATRMPACMHSQYLRRLFLNNDLAAGRYPVQGKPVSLSDVRLPIFCLGTVTDHVAPWRSVFKLHHLSRAQITFVLTTGGHNAGVISQPGHPNRAFQMLARNENDNYLDPETWLRKAPVHEGSWWPAWLQWLNERSGPQQTRPIEPGKNRKHPALAEAPGTYVVEK
jgi:polyhydroxyalkanoate synthase